MFENGHEFELVTRINGLAPYHVHTSVYRFTASNRAVYLVNVERYRLNTYALKFYPRQHKKHPKKYNLCINTSTSTGVSKILRTVLDIALSIRNEDQFASFAFIGAFKISDNKRKEAETTEETQRYRIYKGMVEHLFGSETFRHIYQSRTNSYLLVSKSSEQPDDLDNRIIDMFVEIYPDVSSL